MDRGHRPPHVPTDRMKVLLNVSDDIILNPREIENYAERAPLLNDDDPFRLSHDPMARNNLMCFVRAEVLPTPSIMYREVCRREPYLRNRPRLRSWVMSNLQGTVTPRDRNEKALVTRRCSGCGSSFFGFPLKDHEIRNCGIINNLPRQFLLDFAIANGLSFCGCCNSRSVYHEKCDNPRECLCGQFGHQHHHGVCNEPFAANPVTFKQRVQEMRRDRERRIWWLSENGLLGFHLPTDYLPAASLDTIDRMYEDGKSLTGTGPYLPPRGEEFGDMPLTAYQWKAYSGLKYVELSQGKLYTPIQLYPDEIDWFNTLEDLARAASFRLRNRNVRSALLIHTYDLPLPDFPDDIPAPGYQRELANGGFNRPREDVAPIGERRALEQIGGPPNDDENHQDVDSDDSPAGSVTGVRPPRASQEKIDEALAVIRSNPVKIDEDLVGTILSNPEPSQFIPRWEKCLRFHENASRDSTRAWDLENGEENVHWTVHREQELRKLILEITEPWHVTVRGTRFTTLIPTDAVSELSKVEFPSIREAMTRRIETWQLLLTGNQEMYWDDRSTTILVTYGQYLLDLGLSIVGSPHCFVSLGADAFGGLTAGYIKLIPMISVFQDSRVVADIDAWKSTPNENFVRFQISETQYPYMDTDRKKRGLALLEAPEKAREEMIESVVNAIDSPRNRFFWRAEFPSADVIDLLLKSDIPHRKENLITRGMLMQNILSGTADTRENLQSYETESLSNYVIFMKAIYEAIRVLASVNKSAPVRMGDCLMEMIHDNAAAVTVTFPNMWAFELRSLDWWYTWISVFFVPMLQRISEITCDCVQHIRDPPDEE